jgi:nitroreductase
MSELANILKWMLPAFVRRGLRRTQLFAKLVSVSLCDAWQYARHSSTLNAGSLSKGMLEARIAATYHVIEKGLSFEDTRLGFGQGTIQNLIIYLKDFRARFGDAISAPVQSALVTLAGYVEFHEQRGFDVSGVREEMLLLGGGKIAGGAIKTTKSEMLESGRGDFEQLCKARRSLRQFSAVPVDINLIEEALELAQFAPSVCNRQPTRVHVVCGRERVDEVLRLQGGTRGFAHKVDKVLVITTDLQSFDGIGERSQGHVDGGMYAMNLLYALLFNGVASCPLIWCQPLKTEKRIRQLVGIPQQERLVLLIAVGNVPEEFEVAEAKRFPVKNIYRTVS